MCDEAEKLCYICLSKQASVKERIVGFPDILKQQFLSLPPDGHLLVGMRSSSHSEINLWESISQMGNFCINTTKSKVTINLLLEIVLIEILPSWVLQNQLISEVLRERWCFFFFFLKIRKEEIKTWGMLPHTSPDPSPFNCLVTLSAQGSRAVPDVSSKWDAFHWINWL